MVDAESGAYETLATRGTPATETQRKNLGLWISDLGFQEETLQATKCKTADQRLPVAV
jgi:hypothetical protein